MRLHGWTSYKLDVYMTPEGTFEAIVQGINGGYTSEDAWRGTGDRPMDAIFDAFRSIGKD